MDVLDIIQERYSYLSKTQKQIADYFLNNSDTACFMPLKEVATEANTTEVTVLCFCSKLGFEGFMDFKKQLQQNIKMRMSPNDKISCSLDQLANETKPYEEIINREKSALEKTYRYLDFNAFNRIMEEIKNSKHIYIISHGATEIVAKFLNYRLQQIGFSSSLIDASSTGNIISATANLNHEHLFFIITFPRYSKNIITFADYISSIGGRIVCLTDSINSTVARTAIATLTCNSESSVFYNSLTSAVSMVEFLLSALAIECSHEFLGHRQKVEKAKILLEESRKKVGTDNNNDNSSIKLH
ncbi:MAG: MurR/RpiR family transcriptional regulator [Oscillospiraceae bacterium]